MRCPDCGSDFPVKPEVVVKTEPCKCGMTPEIRLTRTIVAGVICLMMTLLGGCWMSNYYTYKAIEIEPRAKSNGMPMPHPVVPEEKK